MKNLKQNPQIKLLNPLKDDFSVFYDINGDGKPIEYRAKSGQITHFNEIVGKHVKKHLIEQIINVRGWQRYHSWDNARVEIAKEITK